MTDEERLKELGFSSLGKRRLKGDLTIASQHFKGSHREDGTSFSQMSCAFRMHSGRTRGNGHKMLHRKFCLDMRRIFFAIGTARFWNRLLRSGGLSHRKYSSLSFTGPWIT